MKVKPVLLVVTALVSTVTYSQMSTSDLVGSWQGTLGAAKGFRLVLKVAKVDWGGEQADLYSIDHSTDSIPVYLLTLQGSKLKFVAPSIDGAYEGTVSADGQSIHGTWTQGKSSLPLAFERATKETAWPIDTSPHTVQFVGVDDSIKLEVLDWGGAGRPLVLLAGLRDTAHRFDTLAPKLTATYHVYGITRRGFGASSAPVPANGNYSADRLGDDVLAVLDALKLNHPVLAGHSIAGEELSSIATRHPAKVAGLIYLDAGSSYAFYDRSRGDLLIDSVEFRKELEQLTTQKSDPTTLVQELLQTALPGLERDLQEKVKDLQTMPAALRGAQETDPVSLAIKAGEQKYTDIRVPVLAIFAIPHDLGPNPGIDPAAWAAFEARDAVKVGAQADAFEKGIPSARVIRLPHANHYIFLSNEAEVLRAMIGFSASLR